MRQQEYKGWLGQELAAERGRREIVKALLSVVTDHYLRQQYPQQAEVDRYEPSAPQPGEWYYDGVVIRRAR